MADRLTVGEINLLTDVSNKITPTGFVAEQILPQKPVPTATGSILQYGTESLRIPNMEHVGAGKYAMTDKTALSVTTYDIQDYGLGSVVTASDIRRSPTVYKAVDEEVNDLTLRMMLGYELSVASQLTNTGVITQNVTLAGTNQYNNIGHADANPMEDFLTGRNAIRATTGHTPNVAIMDVAVADALSYNVNILSALGFSANRAGTLSFDDLAKALKVERIIAADSFYDSSEIGQTANITRTWGKDIVLAVVRPPAQRQQTLGYTFVNADAPRRNVEVVGLTNPQKAQEITIADNYDNIIYPDSAYLIKAAIA